MGKQGGKAVNKEVSFYKAGSFNPLWHTFFKVIPIWYTYKSPLVLWRIHTLASGRASISASKGKPVGKGQKGDSSWHWYSIHSNLEEMLKNMGLLSRAHAQSRQHLRPRRRAQWTWCMGFTRKRQEATFQKPRLITYKRTDVSGSTQYGGWQITRFCPAYRVITSTTVTWLAQRWAIVNFFYYQILFHTKRQHFISC